MVILNLTQHPATEEQKQAGVVDLPEASAKAVKEALTFHELPDRKDIEGRAEWIAFLAADLVAPDERDDGTREFASSAMIGGAPYLMAPLERELLAEGIFPLYAFSKRITEEVTQPDGSVRKVSVFRHSGFVEAG